jgi:hypothetical protein
MVGFQGRGAEAEDGSQARGFMQREVSSVSEVERLVAPGKKYRQLFFPIRFRIRRI